MPEPIAALREALKAADTVLLTGPMDPDGDSIGACLALARATGLFSDATVHVAGEANYRYSWMPDAESLRNDAQLSDAYDMVVVMDGDRGRLTPRVTELFESAGTTVLVDHHQSSSEEGYDIVLLNPKSPSTCEMVFEVFSDWGIEMNREMATHLYTGIIFDTGGFKHENTSNFRGDGRGTKAAFDGVNRAMSEYRLLTPSQKMSRKANFFNDIKEAEEDMRNR